ncbi:MAG TPA: AMP-binding protein [Acidimicrobiales bacterium]|nr:AMP-binding protein [Acidimicrobiales bacterium]
MRELVAIDMPGGEGFVAELRRAWDSGDAILPVDQRLPDAVKARILDAMRPSWVVTAGGRSRLRQGEPVESGDALVMATSGTTGAPKGVVLTHDAVKASAVATSTRLGVDPGSHRWLACLPLSHVGGLSVVTRSLLTGTFLTVLPGFDKDEVVAAAGRDVFVSLVATALRRVSADLFHTVVLGGSAPPADLPANVVTTYGMTETGSGVVYDGIPLDGVEVDVDPTAENPTGEIRLRGPMLLRAYRDGTVPLDTAGWFATGDAGSFDAGGRLLVAGRIGDLIITGGENVWPAPVEAAIASHPKVAEVAVAGRPDPEWGQRVVAWVVPAETAEPPALDELRALVAETVAPFAAPKEMVIVDSLPKTAIGKVRRDLLTGP